MTVELIHGDAVEVMAGMPENSVDAVCTDPPYGLEFMGRNWDAPWKYPISKTGYTDAERLPRPSFASSRNPMCRRCRKHMRGSRSHQACACDEPDFDEVDHKRAEARLLQDWHERWAREAFRVLKPGGICLSFGGTRTYHRLACAIEDAGFEIRDSMLYWGYATGFPKSHDFERAIAVKTCRLDGRHFARALPSEDKRLPGDHICPPTPESEPWLGWGTALKPAHEPIVVARKPLQGTVAQNVMRWGTGGLNIDKSRIGHNEPIRPMSAQKEVNSIIRQSGRYAETTELKPNGRWPANVLLSHAPGCTPVGVRRVKGSHPVKPGGGTRNEAYPIERTVLSPIGAHAPHDFTDPDGKETVEAWECEPGCPVAELDRQSGVTANGRPNRVVGSPTRQSEVIYGGGLGTQIGPTYLDRGGASRFFFVSKASRRERDAGLEGMPAVERHAYAGNIDGLSDPRMNNLQNRLPSRNHHPTIKPIALMRHLVRLVTPPGGTVLDCFMGSGSTGCACVQEGFDFVGIDVEEEYVAIAGARIAYWASEPQKLPRRPAVRKSPPPAEPRPGRDTQLALEIPD